MTNVDTPDHQQGSVTAQKLLATVAALTAKVTVTLPPNTQTLVVMARELANAKVPKCVGVTSGFVYPVVQIHSLAIADQNTTSYCDVTSAVEAEVTIEWESAPATTWYVYADAFGHIVIDPATSGAVAGATEPRPHYVMLVGGEAGEYLYPLLVNPVGQLLSCPTIPATAAGDHPLTELQLSSGVFEASTTMVAAPPAGKRVRLFAMELASLATEHVVFADEVTTGKTLLAVAGPGQASLAIPNQGYPLPESSALAAGAYTGTGKFFAVVYYTVEFV